jgi:hypothetical protein
VRLVYSNTKHNKEIGDEMPEWNVYGKAPALMVKTVEARSITAAQRKAKQDITGWFFDDDDEVQLSDIKIVRVESA